MKKNFDFEPEVIPPALEITMDAITLKELAELMIKEGEQFQICPFRCGKRDWSKPDEHKHSDDCPISRAYRIVKEQEEDTNCE